jgi:hypothetical protein
MFRIYLLLSSVMYMLSRAFNALCISTTQLYHCLTNQYFVLRESRVNLVFNGGRPKFPCLNTRATGQGGNFRLSRLKRNIELSGCRFSLLGKTKRQAWHDKRISTCFLPEKVTIIARLPPFSPIPGRIGEVQRKLDFSETQCVPHTKSMLPH